MRACVGVWVCFAYYHCLYASRLTCNFVRTTDFGSVFLPFLGPFFQSTQDDFDWSFVANASTPSRNTGPSSEHTGNGGNYAFIEASLPQQPGDQVH